MDRRPAPGSPEAIEAGCTCPVMDNNRGQGYLGQSGLFVMTADCPVHICHPRKDIPDGPTD